MHEITQTTLTKKRPPRQVPGELLLELIDARLHVVGNSVARLEGRVVVGVRRSGRTQWLVVDLDGVSAETHFTDELPAEFDAGVAADVHTAGWIMGVENEPGDLHLVTGDRTLLAAFLQTFLRHTDVLALRRAVSR